MSKHNAPLFVLTTTFGDSGMQYLAEFGQTLVRRSLARSFAAAPARWKIENRQQSGRRIGEKAKAICNGHSNCGSKCTKALQVSYSLLIMYVCDSRLIAFMANFFPVPVSRSPRKRRFTYFIHRGKLFRRRWRANPAPSSPFASFLPCKLGY